MQIIEATDRVNQVRQTFYAFKPANIQDNGLARYPFPAQLEDVTAALDWIKENALDKNFDPDRVGLVGALLSAMDQSVRSYRVVATSERAAMG